MPRVTEKLVAYPPDKPFGKQAVTVPGTKRPGQSYHYRNAIWGLIDEYTPNSLTTLDQIFEDGLKAGKDVRYTWLTYGDADFKRRCVGSALHKLFKSGEVGGGQYEAVGIWSMNRPEWQIIDIALQSYDKVSVSLYDTLGTEAVEYIISHAHLSVVFATQGHIPALLKLAPSKSCLKMVVCIDSLSIDTSKVLRAWSMYLGVKFMELSEFEEFGKSNLIDPIPATPNTVASICYTSGTTAMPKGVLLLHKNLALATQSNLYGLELPRDVVLLSYLPLAHIYERVCELCVIAIGGCIGYFTGDPLRLLEDARLLKPNFFPSVPRVLNRVFQAAMTGGNSPGLKGKIFNKALSVKLNTLRTTGDVTHAFWDRSVFRKIQAVLGGQVKFVSSGSAPISSEVMDFLKVAFSCEVVEGYGLTETCATCSRTWPGDPTASGTVGAPQPVNEVMLIDVPSMNYTSEDKPNPRGELLVRGANCFTTYYKDEFNTKSTVDEDGWVHTGDIAEIDDTGRIKIIDRIKNIMKLAQGEYVALEKIENAYAGLPLVSQIFVYGDSLQSYLVCVLVPDAALFSQLVEAVTATRVSPGDLAGLNAACQDARVVEHVLATLTKVGKQNGLKGFELIRRLHLSMNMFSVETNTMTPTMKIRRKDAYQMYKKELDALYKLGEPSNL